MTSASAERGLLHKVRYTPMRDVLRGRLTGRLDVAGRIESSDLPAPAKRLVQLVVRRTRLWRMEKSSVADELIAHFADGLEGGQTIEELIEHFGDERRVVKLIRRAKKRNRPLIWHVWRGLFWLVLAIAVAYMCMAINFYSGKPTPKVDYVALLNQRITAMPEDQRAWPIYRQAILRLGFYSTRKQDFANPVDLWAADEQWPMLAEWLRAHAAELEMIRTASSKPLLGFLLGSDGSANDPGLWEPGAGGFAPDSLVTVSLPHLNYISALGKILAADARLALRENDSHRWEANVNALLGMAGQMLGSNFLISDWVSLYLRMLAVEEIQRAIHQTPKMLSQQQLLELAHQLSTPGTAHELFDLKSERLLIKDTLQRVFTDDGDGDGRISFEGLGFLRLARVIRLAQPTEVELSLLPLSQLFVASRAQSERKYEALMSKGQALLSRPWWQADYREFNAQRERLERPHKNFGSLIDFVPRIEQLHAVGESYLGERDGALIGIALELYRREHDIYPNSLEALIPRFLPSIPQDRMADSPLHYRVSDKKPLVYSVGSDRDDDGGRRPAGARSVGPAADMSASQTDGDWVLYPKPVSP